jgi:hypothetical protein
LQFHLGIWTVAYRWPGSPQATYPIEGLNDERFPHIAAVRSRSCCTKSQKSPASLRVQSGVAPSRLDFWRPSPIIFIAECRLAGEA